MSHRTLRPLVLPLALCALLCALGLAAARGQDEEPRGLRILVTNDDGIASPGLAALVAELASLGEVYVSAPAENCSGSSASSDGFGRPLTLAEHELEGAVRACAIGGKPVDACQFGILALGRHEEGRAAFDLVVSGINRGANVGELAHYSGTVGAAVAAAHAGLPAIAVSQNHTIQDHAFAARFTTRFARELLERGGHAGTIYSINVPDGDPADVAGVVPAPMGGAEFFVDAYAEATDAEGRSVCRARIQRNARAPEGSDTAYYVARNVTITPLRFDWTDREALADLAGWELQVESVR